MNAKTKLAERCNTENAFLPEGYKITYNDLKGCSVDINYISVALNYKDNYLCSTSHTSYASAIRAVEAVSKMVNRLNRAKLLK